MLKREVLGVGIVSLDTQVPGSTVAVVCNVHGNEPCGRAGLQRVLDAYELRSGSLVIIDANREASLLGPGEIIAHDSSGPYKAPDKTGFSILMPGDQRAINEGRSPEAYYLIRTI